MMSDDDIQFLGINNTPLPRAKSVTGFILHIEKNGNEPEYRMIFPKADGNIVVVGRKPPQQGSGVYDSDGSKAMFRCPVVSRAHAKFTFSDSGLLYVTDTSSHHGTHIRRPRDLHSRRIPTETLVQVKDGDMITFGKSVDKNNEIVRPVVARVELSYNAPIPRTLTSITKLTKSISASSGRYGLRTSDSSQGDSSAANSSSENSNDSLSSSSDYASDHESDIVEVHPPPKLSLSTVVPSANSTFRMLISPASNAPATNPTRGLLPLSSLFYHPIPSISIPEPMSHVDEAIGKGLDAYGQDIFDFGSPAHSAKVIADEEIPIHQTRKASPPMATKMNFNHSVEFGRLNELSRRKCGSRSASPMDLATPSPPHTPPKINNENPSSSSLLDKHKPDVTGSPHHQFWSPLSSPPPLPSNPPPSFLLDRMTNAVQSSARSSCSAEEKPVSPPSTHSASANGGHPGEDEPALLPSLTAQLDDYIPSLSHSTSVDCSEVDESPFAGHAEQEDIMPSIYRFPYEPPHYEPPHHDSPSPPSSHHTDGVHGGPKGLEGNTESSMVPIAEECSFEEPLDRVVNIPVDGAPSEMDELVFDDEVHRSQSAVEGKNTKGTQTLPTGVQVTHANSSPVTSVLQRAGAALSSFKERFSGSNAELASIGQSDIVHSSSGDTASEALQDSELKILEKGLLTAENDIATLQLQYRKYRTRFNDNVQTMNSKLAQLSTFSTSLSKTKDHLEGLECNVATAKGDLEYLRGDVDGFRSEMKTVKGAVDQVQNETDENRMDIDGVRIDVDGVRGEVDSLRDDVDSVKDDVHGNVTSLQSEVSELRIDVEGMRLEFNDMRKDVDDLMGGQSVKETVEDMQDEFRNLREEWDQWKESATIAKRVAPHDVEALSRSTSLLGIREEYLKALQDLKEPTSSKDAELQYGNPDKLLKLQEQSAAEIKILEIARSQVENELQIIVALRQQAELAAGQTTSQSHIVRSSLKRKHADDPAIGEDLAGNGLSGGSNGVDVELHHEPFDTDMSTANVNDSNSSSAMTVSLNADGILVPSPKRARRLSKARRIGTVVAQTATVATIGAVAAWAALAFS
ncbi:hypothetical protein F5050DRAFT_1785393 [Lentinula boryana]|uniref:FHA domain-containing protein n=1 Tax=Lentinula boryana TaxID=40481 RepID=A0ABQ8Q391_9AGAR|nr:hypothetical protein F5050DRAFT_1785393 [Lentinula boryana]